MDDTSHNPPPPPSPSSSHTPTDQIEQPLNHAFLKLVYRTKAKKPPAAKGGKGKKKVGDGSSKPKKSKKAQQQKVAADSVCGPKGWLRVCLHKLAHMEHVALPSRAVL